jgi:tRNA nucleotidyltransferase (CCA-adding enzyme)
MLEEKIMRALSGKKAPLVEESLEVLEEAAIAKGKYSINKDLEAINARVAKAMRLEKALNIVLKLNGSSVRNISFNDRAKKAFFFEFTDSLKEDDIKDVAEAFSKACKKERFEYRGIENYAVWALTK